MTEEEAYLVLNAVPDLGPVRTQKITGYFGSAQDVLKASLSELSSIESIGKKIAGNICSWHKYFDLKKECALIKKYNVKILTINQPEYPVLLKHIYDPPVVLYVRGSIIPQDRYALAIVGSRRASYYGISTARRIAQQVGSRGLTVISGLARGVDTASHKGALSGKGRTIAVFGCGIDRIYPSENKKLIEEIISNGAVITEFPFGTIPYKQNFPKRNRIISGLSIGVIVIEAGKYSGSLITARLAAEQGRQVFSVPGRIDAVTSQGTNVLIKEGARPLLQLEDILEEIEYLLPKGFNPVIKTSQEQPVDLPKLDARQKSIYQGLDKNGLSADDIAAKSGLDIKDVWSTLAMLELKGLIKRLPGSRYVRK